MATASIPKFMGAQIKRREDPALMKGEGRFVSDIYPVGVLQMIVVRSTVGHGKINSIDTSEAAAMDGVHAVWTSDDLKKVFDKPMQLRVELGDLFDTAQSTERYLLTSDEVLFVGDPVAVVIADSLEIGVAAAELVDVDIDDLPAAIGIEEALKDGASIACTSYTSNEACRVKKDIGDVDAVFESAHTVVDVRIDNQRLIPSAIEPRAVVAEVDGDNLTLYTTTQMPHLVKADIVELFDIEADKLRVVAPDVGGGFGAKANVYPEEVLSLVMARALNKPVRWVASRQEDNVATVHGRAEVNYVSFAANENGRILGAKFTVVADCGGRYTRMTPLIPLLAMWMATGTYDIQVLRYEVIGAFTNTTPIEAYRGAGRPEAAMVIERAIDELAAKLEMDPVALRRANFIAPESFPYSTPSGMTYDSGEYAKALDKALELADYEALRKRQATQRTAGGKLLGIGVASYVEICGFGPHEYGSVKVEDNGDITVLTGSSPHGQGHITTWSQIAAETLQVPIEKITVKHGDTDVIPDGVGTFGSRSAPVGGVAIFNNSLAVVERASKVAGHLLEAAAEDIVLEDGNFHVQGVPDRAVSWEQVIEAAKSADLPEGVDGSLHSQDPYNVAGETFPFGTHICVVEIDPDTGVLEIVRYISVDDCGPVINPMIVDGQVHGGLVQGISQALFEGAIYDDGGNLLTGTFVDYAMPRAHMLPNFETSRTVTPSPNNPMGIKGIGEAATIGSTPAVVNAAIDAVRHLGVTNIDMPLTPERVWSAIHGS